jgi:TP901 family phage tail tape measure protein
LSSRIAEAYVQIVPRIDGVAKGINQQLGGIGEQGGDEFGKGFNKSVKAAMVGAASLVAGLAVGKFLKSGIDAAAQLSGGLREVVTLTGLTGKEGDRAFGEFRSAVNGLSGELGLAQETLTSGLYQALSAGVPKETVFDFLAVAGKAAIAGVTDTETAVDGLTTVVNAFGLEAGDAGRVADSLFQAVKGGKTTFGELASSLFNVAPAAAAAGVEFETINAAIATLTAAGVPTSVATNQIRSSLVALQKPSKELDKVFQALGFATAKAAIDANGYQYAIDQVYKAADGDQGVLFKLLRRTEAVNAVNVLAGTGAAKFTSELEAQQAAVGATDAAFAEVDKSRSLERLSVSMETLTTGIGMALLPAVEGLVNVLTPLFTFMADNPAIVQALAVALAALTAIFIGVALATWVMNTALLANPITWIVIGVIALIAALVALVMNWEKVAAFIKNVWDGIVKWLERSFSDLGKWWSNLWGGVIEVATRIWNSIASFLGNIVGGIVDSVINRFQGLISFLPQVWEAFKAVFTQIANFIVGIANSIISAIESMVNFVIDGVNLMISALNGLKFTVPDWVPVIGGKSFGFSLSRLNSVALGRIPQLAKGGFVDRPTTAIIGEAGPEVVTPLKDFERMMGLDGSGGSRVINYYAAENKSIDSEQALLQAIKRAKVITGW